MWVLVGCLFFPNPFRVKSDLRIMENVWKIAVLITTNGAKESSAGVWCAWLRFLGEFAL